jgi:hypothetical protein
MAALSALMWKMPLLARPSLSSRLRRWRLLLLRLLRRVIG